MTSGWAQLLGAFLPDLWELCQRARKSGVSLSMKPLCAQHQLSFRQSWRVELQGLQGRSLTEETCDQGLWSHSWEDALTCDGSWVRGGNKYQLEPMER